MRRCILGTPLLLLLLTGCSIDTSPVESSYPTPEELMQMDAQSRGRQVEPTGYTIFMVDLSDSVSSTVRDRLYIDVLESLDKGEKTWIVQIGAVSGSSDAIPLEMGPLNQYFCERPPVKTSGFSSYGTPESQQGKYQRAGEHIDAIMAECEQGLAEYNLTGEQAVEQLGAYFSDQLVDNQGSTNIVGAIKQADVLRPANAHTTFVILSDMWEQTTADNSGVSFDWQGSVTMEVHQYQPRADPSREGEWSPRFLDWGAGSYSWEWLTVTDSEQGVAPAFTGRRRIQRESVQRKPSGGSSSKSKSKAPTTTTGCPSGQVYVTGAGCVTKRSDGL